MNNNSNSHWFDHFITWPQHHRHHNLPCGRNGGRKRRSGSNRSYTDTVVVVRFDMDATQTYSDHIKMEECVEPMWFTSEELTLMDYSPYKEEEREQQQQRNQQRDCPNDNDNYDRNTMCDDIVVDTLPSGKINDDDDEGDRKVKSKGDGNDDRHQHRHHQEHHQRGLEYTIPKQRIKRRLNLFHARSVVFQNQRRCDPTRLAKLYHNETRSVERDARRVGISDAKAVGMDPWPEATGLHHRQAVIFGFG